MRVILLVVLLAFVWSERVGAQDTPTFSEAYKAYNTAIEAENFAAALPYARVAYELGIQRFGEGSKEHAVFAYNLGQAEGQVNGLETAEPFLRESIRIFERTSGKKSIDLLDPLIELGDLYQVSMNFYISNEGLNEYERALKILKAEYGDQDILFAETALKFGNLAMLRGDAGMRRSGIRLIRSAHRTYVAAFGEDSWQTALASYALGKAHLASNKFRLAQKAFLEALPVIESRGEQSASLLVSIHSNLVLTYDRLGDEEKASAHCVQVAYNLPPQSNMDYRPLFKEMPIYPSRALRTRKEAQVLIEFTVTPSGRVADVTVIEDNQPGYRFDEAAVEAVSKQWYAPQIAHGQPVATTGVRNLITFEIAD